MISSYFSENLELLITAVDYFERISNDLEDAGRENYFHTIIGLIDKQPSFKMGLRVS